jgi:hypothetical protein
LKFDITNMSANNRESEIISLCNDMVEDLAHVEPEIVEDESDVDLSMNDLNKPSAYNGPLEPSLGMEFDDVEDSCTCYNAYARMRCKAMMGLRKIEETWIVSKFETSQTHELLTPKSTSLLRGHRVISRAQKNLIDTLNKSGVPPRKIMLVLSKESEGDYNVGCISVDVQNCLGNKRRNLLEEGDAQRMYKYFIESRCKTPGFVYVIQVDENGRMGNCFRVDARSRLTV